MVMHRQNIIGMYIDILVYNEDEDSCYVHHDIILDSFPLCLEWLSFDPTLNGKSGNYNHNVICIMKIHYLISLYSVLSLLSFLFTAQTPLTFFKYCISALLNFVLGMRL